MSQARLLPKELDEILAIQFAIAWIGEGGDEPRLNWWNTEVMSSFGGYDNLRELVPYSAKWLGFKTIREAARRVDEGLRLRASEPGNIYTLFRLGFELDEQLDYRLGELVQRKASLPALLKRVGWLEDPVQQEWRPDVVESWLKELVDKKMETKKESIGRRLVGGAPESVLLRMQCLASALLPLSESYSLPHYRISHDGA